MCERGAVLGEGKGAVGIDPALLDELMEVIVDPLIARAMGSGIPNQPDPAAVAAELHGLIDDNETHDLDGDGYTECQGDCDESDDSTHPGALDLCDDGLDNDCDGDVDEAP